MGAGPAEAAGLAKELVDAHSQSGFSFADLAADRAGIRFARGVIDKKLALPMLAQSFSVPGFMPSTKDLPEGLTATDVAAQFGSKDDARLLKQLRLIEEHAKNGG